MQVTIDLEEVANNCFVIMPFASKFDLIYQEVLKPAIEEIGLKALRADDIYGSKRIMHDVWQCIRTARIVLAELSGRNPNVLYELGLCHAVGKPVVIITNAIDDVPFDLKDIRCIVYEKDHPRWGEYLKNDISQSLRAVLSDKQSTALLSHISIDTKYPEPPKEPITPEVSPIHIQLGGQWLIEELFEQRSRKRETQIFLTQEEGRLTGVAVTNSFSLISSDDFYIVNQTISGTIVGSKLNLVATSYQFIKAPEVIEWLLESWRGTVKNSDLIEGVVTDGQNEGKFVMKRVDS